MLLMNNSKFINMKLALDMIGDVLLQLGDFSYFSYGIIFFMLGHIIYLHQYHKFMITVNLILLSISLLFNNLNVRLICYLLILKEQIILYRGYQLWGILLFTFSDYLVIGHRLNIINLDSFYGSIIIMTSYYFAQNILVRN